MAASRISSGKKHPPFFRCKISALINVSFFHDGRSLFMDSRSVIVFFDDQIFDVVVLTITLKPCLVIMISTVYCTNKLIIV